MEARVFGIKTILDSASRWLKEGIKARPFLIKPNVQETEELLGEGLYTEEAIIQGALNLVAMGIEIVAISRGKDGIIAASNRTIVRAVPPKVNVKSTVGAGDSAVATSSSSMADQSISSGSFVSDGGSAGTGIGGATIPADEGPGSTTAGSSMTGSGTIGSSST